MNTNRLVTKSYLENNKRACGNYTNRFPFPALYSLGNVNVSDRSTDVINQIKTSFQNLESKNRCKFYQAVIEKFKYNDGIENIIDVKYEMKEIKAKDIKIDYISDSNSISFGVNKEFFNENYAYTHFELFIYISFLYIEIPGEYSYNGALDKYGILWSDTTTTSTLHMVICQGDINVHDYDEASNLKQEVEVKNMTNGLKLIVRD